MTISISLASYEEVGRIGDYAKGFYLAIMTKAL
jgi:hypothetical protein